MAFNGSGVFARLYSWVADAAANVDIEPARMDAEMDGFATGLSTCITRDGQTTITANLPMNSNKLTGLAAGSSNGDSVRYEQVVRLADDQTVAGVKTFSNNPVVANTSPRLRLDDTDGPSGRRMVDVAISDGTVQIILRDSAGTLVQTLFSISTTSSGAAKFTLGYSGLPLYANNAAARADGLDDGDLYRVSGGGLAVTTP